MVEVIITESQVLEAKDFYPFDILNGSITNGVSNIYGALGEIVIRDYFKSRITSSESSYDYDLIIDNYKIDAKTKKTTVVPQPNYYCSISDWNVYQKCDFYVFVRVMTDYSKAYILGYITPIDFYNKAVFKQKGELDINGFVFKCDCYNLEISFLKDIKIAFNY